MVRVRSSYTQKGVKKRRAVGKVARTVGARGVGARELVMEIAMGEGSRGEEDDMAVGDHWGGR